MAVPYPPEKRRAWLEAYAETRSKTTACRIAGVSFVTIRKWEGEDKEFAAGIAEIQMRIGDLVHNTLLDRALNGWEEPVLFKGSPVTDPATGETMMQHRYSDKLMLAAAQEVSGWGRGGQFQETPRKEVHLIGPGGKPMGIRDLIKETFTRAQLTESPAGKVKALPAPKKPKPKNGKP